MNKDKKDKSVGNKGEKSKGKSLPDNVVHFPSLPSSVVNDEFVNGIIDAVFNGEETINLSDEERSAAATLIKALARELSPGIKSSIDDDPSFLINTLNRSEMSSIAKNVKRLSKHGRFMLADCLDCMFNAETIRGIAKSKGIKVKRNEKKSETLKALSEFMLSPDTILKLIYWSTPEELEVMMTIGLKKGSFIPGPDDVMPTIFMRCNYIYPIESGFILAEDFWDVFKKLYHSKQVKKEYDRFSWIQKCLGVSLDFYGKIPLSVLAMVVGQNSKYAADEQQLKDHILSQPPDYIEFTLEGDLIEGMSEYSEETEEKIRPDNRPYYIPSVSDIDSGQLIPVPAEIIIGKLIAFLSRNYGIDDDELFEMTYDLYYGIADNEKEAAVVDFHDIIRGYNYRKSFKPIEKIIDELEPHVRKIVNHGFTDAELEELPNKVAKEGKKVVPIRAKRSRKKKGDGEK